MNMLTKGSIFSPHYTREERQAFMNTLHQARDQELLNNPEYVAGFECGRNGTGTTTDVAPNKEFGMGYWDGKTTKGGVK
jgi:hypothetical protein